MEVEMTGTRQVGAPRIVRIGLAGTPRGAVELGGPTRIIAPILGADREALDAEMRLLAGPGGASVDLVEWRVDPLLAALVPGADAAAEIARAWEQAVCQSPLPVLATIRTSAEGGEAALEATEYSALVQVLSHLADAVDVEIDRPGAPELIAGARAAGAIVVASHHDFSATPPSEAILGVLSRMDAAGADVLKIACRARGAQDALRLLDAQLRARADFGSPVIAIGMGGAGALTRIAGSRFGSAATFASLGASSAPGQLSVEETRGVLDLLERA